MNALRFRHRLALRFAPRLLALSARLTGADTAKLDLLRDATRALLREQRG